MQLFVRKALIILLSICGACIYGVVHDQITARLCLEYFTIAHPPLFHTRSTSLLALYWGVAATIGIGALLGVVLARVSQAGDSAQWSVLRLLKAILLLLSVMGASAVASGVIGYWLSHSRFIGVPVYFAPAIPASRHDLFMAVWFAHCASYIVGLSGSAVLCFHVWNARGHPRVMSVFPHTAVAMLRVVLLTLLTAYILWIRFGF